MVGSGLQPDLNAILSIFSLYAGVILGYPPADMLRFLFVAHAFSPMLCVTRPMGSNRHKT